MPFYRRVVESPSIRARDRALHYNDDGAGIVMMGGHEAQSQKFRASEAAIRGFWKHYRAAHEAGMRQGVMYAATKGMLLDRVFTIRNANLFEPHRYRHVIGQVRLKGVEDGTALAHAPFIAARIMQTGETTLFATGRYLDRIDISGPEYRFTERIVVLDSDRIDTLLAIPL
ncbi:MAG: aromatic-ring-hydroxylating dioxygenase subunit beta [Alphaproteobacteria bacterium]